MHWAPQPIGCHDNTRKVCSGIHRSADGRTSPQCRPRTDIRYGYLHSARSTFSFRSGDSQSSADAYRSAFENLIDNDNLFSSSFLVLLFHEKFRGDSRSLLEPLYIYAAPTTNKNLIARVRMAGQILRKPGSSHCCPQRLLCLSTILRCMKPRWDAYGRAP